MSRYISVFQELWGGLYDSGRPMPAVQWSTFAGQQLQYIGAATSEATLQRWTLYDYSNLENAAIFSGKKYLAPESMSTTSMA